MSGATRQGGTDHHRASTSYTVTLSILFTLSSFWGFIRYSAYYSAAQASCAKHEDIDLEQMMTVTPMPRSFITWSMEDKNGTTSLRCPELDRILECNVGSTNIVQPRWRT